MKKITLMAVFILLAGIAVLSIAEENAVKKEDTEKAKTQEKPEITIKFGTEVENRELQGEAESFPAGTEKIYCWTHIKGVKEGSQFKHVWYYGEKKVVEVLLSVKSASYRTWSYKTISSSQTGEWKVEIVDSEGNVVKEGTFTIEGKAEEKTETKTEKK